MADGEWHVLPRMADIESASTGHEYIFSVGEHDARRPFTIRYKVRSRRHVRVLSKYIIVIFLLRYVVEAARGSPQSSPFQ
jgi:hypothetical protein